MYSSEVDHETHCFREKKTRRCNTRFWYTQAKKGRIHKNWGTQHSRRCRQFHRWKSQCAIIFPRSSNALYKMLESKNIIQAELRLRLQIIRASSSPSTMVEPPISRAVTRKGSHKRVSSRTRAGCKKLCVIIIAGIRKGKNTVNYLVPRKQDTQNCPTVVGLRASSTRSRPASSLIHSSQLMSSPFKAVSPYAIEQQQYEWLVRSLDVR